MTTIPLISIPAGLTIRKLKELVIGLAEIDKYGDEYTVWIETGFAMSSLVIEICPLNERGDGADILFVSGAFSGRE